MFPYFPSHFNLNISKPQWVRGQEDNSPIQTGAPTGQSNESSDWAGDRMSELSVLFPGTSWCLPVCIHRDPRQGRECLQLWVRLKPWPRSSCVAQPSRSHPVCISQAPWFLAVTTETLMDSSEDVQMPLSPQPSIAWSPVAPHPVCMWQIL